MTRNEALDLLSRLASRLERKPTRQEFLKYANVTRHTVEQLFGSFSIMCQALQFDFKEGRGKQKFIYKKQKLESHTVHAVSLEDLFKRFNSPPSIKMICMPDTHEKYKSVEAVQCFIRFVSWYQPNVFMIMGDFLDAEGLSHWPSDSYEPRRIIPEIISARVTLDTIDEALSVGATATASPLKLYLEGNHEDWCNQYARAHPEMHDGLEQLDMEISVKRLLQLPQRGYHYFPVNHFVRIGKAHFTHGLYTGMNHAKAHLDRLKCNIYYGHLHDDQSYTQSSIHGSLEAQSLGCLCRLDAKFLKGKPNNWTHAFGIFEFFPDGEYTVMVPKIRNGRMSFMGKVF